VMFWARGKKTEIHLLAVIIHESRSMINRIAHFTINHLPCSCTIRPRHFDPLISSTSFSNYNYAISLRVSSKNTSELSSLLKMVRCFKALAPARPRFRHTCVSREEPFLLFSIFWSSVVGPAAKILHFLTYLWPGSCWINFFISSCSKVRFS
jgi:hypothetical protein